MEKIISLCKRRGFVFPGSEIYGGFANTWDYGPIGVELLNSNWTSALQTFVIGIIGFYLLRGFFELIKKISNQNEA